MYFLFKMGIFQPAMFVYPYGTIDEDEARSLRFTSQVVRWYTLSDLQKKTSPFFWIRSLRKSNGSESPKKNVYLFAKHHWFFLRKKVALFSKLQRQLLATKCLDHLEWMNNPTDKMPKKPSGVFFLSSRKM